MLVLGIESSCDETSAAVIRNGTLLSNVISSQLFHSRFGGVVPELASREHLRVIAPIVQKALDDANVSDQDVEVCAATSGPGLIGSLLVGLNFGKGFAVSHDIPFVAIHHLEAHIFSVFLEHHDLAFPFIVLIVSGGHTLLYHVREFGRYEKLGRTRDDAAGEAFDKVAKMLGLPYPGGPEIDRRARHGDPAFHDFPRAGLNTDDLDFSFSGIKTSVLYFLRDNAEHLQSEAFINDVSASFQRAMIDILVEKTRRAVERTGVKSIAVVGGVSANSELQARMRELATALGLHLAIPSLDYSTDNAAMIAKTGELLYSSTGRSMFDATAFARSEDFSN